MIRVNMMFSDHMVLQRGKNVPVWGTGVDDEKVIVECRGFRAETVVREGCWRTALPAFEAGGPYELQVSSAEHNYSFHDVWFGDVWLAGGQSNMQFSLQESAEGPLEIPNSRYPNLRYYQVPRVAYEDGAEHTTSWTLCTPESAPAFSAVAYFFAKRIMEEENVPIGLISCNWDGTSASCWVGENVLENDPELRVYLVEFQEKIKDFDWTKYEVAEQYYNNLVNEYLDRQSRNLTREQLGNYPWPPPISPHSFLRPSGIYGTMLRKTVPYGIRGFLYYQGETDADKPHIYDRLLGKLIETWRKDWHDSALPFLYVQLPVYGCSGDPDGESWALLREAQYIVSRHVPNAWMAVAWEHGEENYIHPQYKRPVGERLALLALEHVYHREVESSGPVWKDVHFENERAILRFDCASQGLGTRGNKRLTGFEIAGEDLRYFPAEAEIDGDTVALYSAPVPAPIAVRYGWANYSNANLINSYGLPATPFRTSGRV